MNMRTLTTLITKKHDFSSQQGVALIMVLGLLSVMLLMGVSFAIVMRTERVSAGNYLDTVKANQLVRSALHLAMADIYQRLHMVERDTCSVDIASSQIIVSNASVYTTGLQIALHNVLWPHYPIYSIYKSPTTIQIASNNSDAMAGNYIDLTSYSNVIGKIIKRANPNGYPYPPWGAIASYSNNVQRPFSLTNDALKYIPASLISAVTAADSASQSNYWINIETTVNGKTTTVGRVAYLVANCSGILDANYVGGKTRAGGTDPAEIAIEYLDEIGSEAAKQSFVDYRNAKGPFETLPKLADWKSSWHPSNMFCYSGFLENEWTPKRLDVKGKLDISGDAYDLSNPARRDLIIGAFWASGLTNVGEAETAYINLIDYVDSNSVPLDLHTSVEAVPMINEIKVDNTVTYAATNYIVTSTFTVELWYPFGFNNTTPFTFTLEANITLMPAYKNITLPPISISNTFTCSPSSFTIFAQTSSNYVTRDPLADPPDPPPEPEVTWTASIANAEVSVEGQPVDKFDLPLICISTTKTTTASTNMSKECIDPRFNWDADSSNQWSSWTNTSSMDDVNLITKDWWLNHPGCDNTMEVANRRLQSINELTYLIYSTQAWTTIDTGKHKVHDYFCLGPFPVMRGYVNPNTHIPDVLAATFFNVQAYTNGDVTTKPDAALIAKAIMDGKGSGYYTTRQEVVTAIISSPIIPTYIDPTILINKTVNLLNLRQNLFVIIIEVHIASGGNIPANPVKQKAVAIVWRDPFRDNFYVRSLIFF